MNHYDHKIASALERIADALEAAPYNATYDAALRGLLSNRAIIEAIARRHPTITPAEMVATISQGAAAYANERHGERRKGKPL
jgi:hypothetical protein